MNEIMDFEDLIELYLEQYRSGTASEVNEFAERYPQYTQKLLDLLPLLRDLEGAGTVNSSEVVPEISLPANLPGSDYRLLKEIGHGGMGVVLEALQISLNRKVALKLLSPSFVTNSLQRELFEQESRVIAMLHHPNIVRVYSAGSAPEYCYYAMELIDGKSLNQYDFSSLTEIANVGLQAADALAYAHRCKVVHRDIKPSNLLLDVNRTLHVSDFGLAFILQDSDVVVENPDNQCGTMRYMPPERLTNGINSFSGDQYSLGVTLYELVAQKPFLTEQNHHDLLRRISEGSFPPLKCKEPDLAAIINKSISLNPDNRYKSMNDMATDLRHFLNHEPVSAAAISWKRRFMLWVKRKPAVAVLTFLSSLCTLAFIIALVVGYMRTSSALKLAERNATIADTALTNIFNHIENQPPSPNDTHFLATLMPYYQEIAQQGQLSKSKIADTNRIIGICALRTGDYALAETAFRRLYEIQPNPSSMNLLSESLRKQNKINEADQLSRQVVNEYCNSDSINERYEVVQALKALSTYPNSEETFQAFQIIKELLFLEPSNPEYRFQYATILGYSPRLFPTAKITGIKARPVVLLNELTEEHPDRPDYGLALVELMYKKLRGEGTIKKNDKINYELASSLSDQYLYRFYNVPSVVVSTVRFREAYANVLRKNGLLDEAEEDSGRLLYILTLLSRNSEISDPAMECLIQLQLQRSEQAVRDNRPDVAMRFLEDINRELKQYKGTSRKDFQKRLTILSKCVKKNNKL